MQTFALYSITEMTSKQIVYHQFHYFCNLRTKLIVDSLVAHLEFNYL